MIIQYMRNKYYFKHLFDEIVQKTKRIYKCKFDCKHWLLFTKET